MIDLSFQHDLLILLRALLFLVPFALTLCLGWRYRDKDRYLVGGVFSFLYSMGLLLPAHALAISLGFWRYGGDALMLLGMPADLWFGGSFLFGPAIFFAFPRLSPLIFTLATVALQALMFRSLHPLVIAGNGWFYGVTLIFAVIHIPALYLARWTALDVYLPRRATLLAFGYGSLAFVVLPTLIMQAMGGSWDLTAKPAWSFMLVCICLTPFFVLGLSAVQMFVVHGEGTPIPLDKTKKLVTSGIYAYLTNPMQVCSAASWIIIGVFLHNAFVSLAAAMAVIFVQGMVRWYNRSDLLVRFPEGWPEYRTHVREWLPRWRPWLKQQSTLLYSPASGAQKAFVAWLEKQGASGLSIHEAPSGHAEYVDGQSGARVSGIQALAYSLFHINFAWALIASAALILPIPWQVRKT